MADGSDRRQSELRQLASRVENLTEHGNFSIEQEVHRALGRTPPSGFEVQYEGVRLPVYTRSRDDAASVAPPDWHAKIDGCNDSWHVELTHTPSGSLGSVTAFALTEALARTAAGLRAQAVMEGAA
jgi:hypothetical protein